MISAQQSSPGSSPTLTDVTRLSGEEEPESTQRLPMADRTIVDVPAADVAAMAASLADDPTPSPLPWGRPHAESVVGTLGLSALVLPDDIHLVAPRVDAFTQRSRAWRATVAVSAAIVLSVLAACAVGYGLAFRLIPSWRNHHV